MHGDTRRTFEGVERLNNERLVNAFNSIDNNKPLWQDPFFVRIFHYKLKLRQLLFKLGQNFPGKGVRGEVWIAKDPNWLFLHNNIFFYFPFLHSRCVRMGVR